MSAQDGEFLFGGRLLARELVFDYGDDLVRTLLETRKLISEGQGDFRVEVPGLKAQVCESSLTAQGLAGSVFDDEIGREAKLVKPAGFFWSVYPMGSRCR
ncbi:MAG: hypothetical protein NZ742_06565 [Acidobacteria bacterium]|nr:hypothetical protein [Acidobacteriota bacterium]MDW7984548.1 hypothetical protein [Acidobacteriota bacterium]